MDSQNFEGRTHSFLQWFKELPGATFSDSIEIVDLRDRNAGRGIVAVHDVAPETTLFTIPRRAIINVQTSDLPKHLPAVFNTEDDPDVDVDDEPQPLDSWASLILIMIYEYLRGDQSPWKPYFDVLPQSFDTPMFWSGAEMDELQASAMCGKVGKAEAEDMFRTRLLPVFRNNAGVFPLSAETSDEEFASLAHRMGSTIMAYAFDLENDEDKEDEDEEDGWVEDREGKSMMGMVPMADILNADAEFNAHVNHGEDSLTVTALRHIKAGEEILNYYGPHPNSELLRRYGYVTPKHARYDVVEIPWQVVESALSSQLGLSPDTLEKVRERIDEDELEDTFVLERETGDPHSDGTLPDVGPVALPADLQDQLKRFLKTIAKIHPEAIPDKRKRDEMHMTIIAIALRDMLSRYPTSMVEDRSLLQQGGLSARGRMAAEVRLGEKVLLQEAQAAVHSMMEELSSTETDGGFKRARQ